MVKIALNVERVRNNEQSRRDKQFKRGPGQSSSSFAASKRPRGPQGQSQSQSQPQRPKFQPVPRRGQSAASVASSPGTAAPAACSHYGKKHKGECWFLTRGCFQCGAIDHFHRDCP